MAIKPVQQLVDEAKADLDNLSPAEAKRRADEDGALLLDIRDVRELQRGGTAPGAMHAPRGMLEFWIDPESPYFKEVFSEDRQFILFCASGWRSALSAKTLKDMGLENVAHVESGFTGWEGDGMPVQDYETFKAKKS